MCVCLVFYIKTNPGGKLGLYLLGLYLFECSSMRWGLLKLGVIMIVCSHIDLSYTIFLLVFLFFSPCLITNEWALQWVSEPNSCIITHQRSITTVRLVSMTTRVCNHRAIHCRNVVTVNTSRTRRLIAVCKMTTQQCECTSFNLTAVVGKTVLVDRIKTILCLQYNFKWITLKCN